MWLTTDFFLNGTLDDVICHSFCHMRDFCVGYAGATFSVKGEIKEKNMNEESLPVRIGQESLQYFMQHGSPLTQSAEALTPELIKPAGVFVSLKKNGKLRGCIGTILPTQSDAAGEIIRNAVSAATEDPRFPKVSSTELPLLEVSVDILGSPEKIESMPNWIRNGLGLLYAR